MSRMGKPSAETNRRMQTRMSGGVGGALKPPPIPIGVADGHTG